MKKMKIVIEILLINVILLIISTTVNAADKKNTTSQINDVTVQWEYTENEAGQIENLKCNNPTELKGNIEIPAELGGKAVVEIGFDAFKSASQITGVKVPSSVTRIESSAFENCTSLSNVDLGSIKSIDFNAFKDCPNLKSIKIPKTLINGSTANQGVFAGTTKLTSVIFEEDLTEIPAGILQDCSEITSIVIPTSVTKINCYAFKGTGISKIEIPSSVKEIDNSAFENCTNLNSVDLGNLASISFNVFKDCPNLKSIKIPKTLIKGSLVGQGVFTGTTKLTSVIFEEGLTEIPESILQDCSEITSIVIPTSVTKINSYAFLGTGISEIEIPNSVKDISYYAFKNCPNLVKVTILDNCSYIGITSKPTMDSVFVNHNEDLTIYCYEGSKIAEYAIATNIKYVYIQRPASSGVVGEQLGSNDKEDPTTAKGQIPQTGENILVISGIIAVLGIGIFTHHKFNKFKGI